MGKSLINLQEKAVHMDGCKNSMMGSKHVSLNKGILLSFSGTSQILSTLKKCSFSHFILVFDPIEIIIKMICEKKVRG